MKNSILVFLAITLSTISFAQSGLKVGESAPDFTAKDQKGKLISLQKALKKGKVVLIFYRGYWCPNCSLAVRNLQDSLHLLTDKNVSVIAISPEGADGVAKTISKSKATFSVLSDKGLKISEKYDVSFKVTPDMDAIHEQYKIDVIGNNEENGNNLVKPSAFIINKQGKIVYRYVNDFPYADPKSADRVTVKQLLENL